jgi:hypothetical protein
MPVEELEKEKKRFNISVILNIITIIGFLITIGTFIYSSGKKDARLEQVEKEVVTLKITNETLKNQLNEQNTATQEVNVKLDLLLKYFNIVGNQPPH